MHYFTGTTLESLESIIKDGYILIKPPHRVWKDYSEDYVYFVPFEEKNEEERNERFCYAMEQSDFTINTLNHSRRVVIEVAGLDEEMVEEDPDAAGIYAVRYPFDISISLIKAIFIEKKDKTKEIKEINAIMEYFKRKNEKTLKWVDTDLLCSDIEEEKAWEYKRIGIPNLELVELDYLYDEGELENRYMDLLENLHLDDDFVCFTLKEYQNQVNIA